MIKFNFLKDSQFFQNLPKIFENCSMSSLTLPQVVRDTLEEVSVLDFKEKKNQNKITVKK